MEKSQSAARYPDLEDASKDLIGTLRHVQVLNRIRCVN